MKKLFLILLGLISVTAHANGCGGEYQAQTGTCRIIGPDGRQILYNVGQPQSGNSLPPKKIIRYVDVHVPSKYGAYAANDKTGYSAGALNQSSLAKAKKEAIRACGQGGNQAGCKVVSWVRNGCIAGAKGKVSKRWVAYYSGEKRGEAEAVALQKCIDDGAKECQINLSEGCSLPDGM